MIERETAVKTAPTLNVTTMTIPHTQTSDALHATHASETSQSMKRGE